MKKHTVLSLIAGCTMALISAPIFADDLPAKTMPMSTILKNLQTDGYLVVEKIKFKDGFYKAEVINSEGREIDVKLSSETGKIVEPKESKQGMNMLAAVKKAEEAGYHSISKVKSKKDVYKIKALDKEGKEADLKIDAFSGVITKD